MAKRIMILVLLLIVCCGNGFAQTSDSLGISKNGLYFELCGSTGLFYSISYDRIILKKNQNNVSLSLGMQYSSIYFSEGGGKLLTMSPQINYLYGHNKKFLEIGVGYCFDVYDSHHRFFSTRIGYRYQKKNGLFFRIGFTPMLLKYYGEYFIIPWGGIGLGHSF